MKKFCFPFLLFFPLLALASCDEGKIDPLTLPIRKMYEENSTYVERYHAITHAEFLSFCERKMDFLLLVVDHDSTCTCYFSFQEALEPYLQKYDALIYSIDPKEFSGGEKKGLNIISGNETLAIFKAGELLEQKVTDSTSDPFTSDSNVVKNWLEERVSWGSGMEITLPQLNKLYEGDIPFSLAYLRSSCPDCLTLEEEILYPLLKEKRGTLYMVDTDVPGIRFDEEGNFDETQWKAFKEEVGLSAKEDNCPSAYQEGYVPSILYIDPNLGTTKRDKVVAGMTYLNDQIQKDEEGYFIASSFYNDARIPNNEWLSNKEEKMLEGKRLKEEEVLVLNDSYSWKVDYAKEFHNPLAEEFLDFYCPVMG